MKIKTRMCLVVIGILVVVVATLSIVLVTRARAMQIATATASELRLVRQMVENMEKQYQVYIQAARNLATVMGGMEKNTPAQDRRQTCIAAIEGLVTANEGMIGMYAVWKPNAIDGDDAAYAGQPGALPDGTFAPNWNRASGTLEFSAYNRAAGIIKNGMIDAEQISDPEPRTVNGKDALQFAFITPIKNSAGVVGIVGVNINASHTQAVLNSFIHDTKNYSDADIMAVYSNAGMVLSHSVENRVGKPVTTAEASLYSVHMNEVVNDIKNGNEGMYEEYSSALGTNIRVVLEPLTFGNAKTPWSVMVGVREDVIMRPITGMIQFAVVMAALFTIAAAFIIYLVINKVMRRITNVANAIKDISEGEGDLTRRLKILADDEVGALGTHFNNTMEKIRQLVSAVKQQTTTLFDIGGNLAANMTETAAAVNQITANIQSIKGRALSQNASVTQTNATVDAISVNIDKLHTSVEAQTSSVSQSSSAIEQMLANIDSVTQTLMKNAANVENLAGASEVGRAGLQEVATDIQEISRQSEGLLEINAVMENIASQTNLLSMNAAIEAAHAGEAGKGFAVVADEIRKLAESSSEQSKTTGSVLKKIKESIDKITKSTDSVLEKFAAIDSGVKTVSEQELNIRSAMEEQSAGSKQILEAIGHLNDITQHVKGGAEEMKGGAEQVKVEGGNLEMETQEITNGINEMASGAEQINVAVNQINDLTGHNRDSIDVLVNEVSKFKVA
jgi:methyl-accepting chemotaxis protein